MKLSTNAVHDIRNNFFERDTFKSHVVADVSTFFAKKVNVTKSPSVIYRWKANDVLNKKFA